MNEINPSGGEAKIPFQLEDTEWWSDIPACAGWYRPYQCRALRIRADSDAQKLIDAR